MPGVATASPAQDLDLNWSATLEDHVISLRWSPGGTLVAAALVSGPIYLLDGDTGEVRQRLAGHGFGTTQVDWQPGGALLVSAGQDGTVRWWDPQAGKERAAAEGGAAWVERVAWSPKGEFVAAAAGKAVRLYDAQGQLLRNWPAQESTIADLAWKPGANVLASCGYYGLTFWEPERAEAARRFDWKGSMLVLAWSPDGRYIATGNQDSTIQFWNIASGKELRMWGYPAKIRELAWDCRSRYLASGGASSVVVWDCSGKGPAGTKPVMLEFHEERLTQLAFQGEGKTLASGCNEGWVAMWRPGNGRKPLGVMHLGAAVTQLTWSPSNRRLAAGSDGGRVAVFCAPKG